MYPLGALSVDRAELQMSTWELSASDKKYSKWPVRFVVAKWLAKKAAASGKGQNELRCVIVFVVVILEDHGAAPL